MVMVYMHGTEDGSERWKTEVEAKRALRELAKKYPEARADFERIFGHSHEEETVDEYQEPGEHLLPLSVKQREHLLSLSVKQRGEA